MVLKTGIPVLSALLVLFMVCSIFPVAAENQTMNMSVEQTTLAEGNLTNNTVAISNFAFNPAVLNVTVNSTVTWTNEDTAPHIIGSEKGAPVEFKSPSISKGETFEFNFTTAGAYPYYCTIHPSMLGTIQVNP